jgi:hypothetical protein
VRECLYGGKRGGGKTDALLMDFLRDVGKGWGVEWRGVIFRRTYPELEDIIAKANKWIPQIFPTASYNKAEHVWSFDGGEMLKFRHAASASDYWSYHGHAYPYIGWEELTNWPSGDLYEAIMTLCRSTVDGIPKRIRATANPWGVGHGWVKTRFVDPAPANTVFTLNGQQRAFVSVDEMIPDLLTDGEYLSALEGVNDEAKKRAWLDGDWDIAAGGIFTGIWTPSLHVIEPFQIPRGWRISRSFDWGSSKPWACVWFAESDGTEYRNANDEVRCVPRGTVFAAREIYGWNGKPNEGTRELAREVARRIAEEDRQMGRQVAPGPADSAIFDTQNGQCIADDMAREGVRWVRADKSAGSRRNGWELVRNYMAASTKIPMEDPGMFVFTTCRHFIRTVPGLPRSDKDPDDVDTNAEDHIGDLLRYYLSNSRKPVGFASL